MNSLFTNLPSSLNMGMNDFLRKHPVLSENKNLKITIIRNTDNKLIIKKDKNEVIIDISRDNQLYRCLTILKEHINDDSFSSEEKCYFDTCGAMFDVSQASSLLTIENIKKMLLYLAAMGYNMMMIYCEDCFELEGEPYWANMRPKYTMDEFKLIDEYASSLGIELIPCVQTLGHLTDILRKPAFSHLSDTSSVLEVGNEKVYELIEKIIAQMSKTFKSRRIHVGLDEAWGLGTGRYLKKNGYRSPNEIMQEHVSKVSEICAKYNLKPMMWSDMFFRNKNSTGQYYKEVTFTQEDIEKVPENMELVYWDYYFNEPEHYEMMINQHKVLTDKIVFAGAARSGYSFGTHLNKTITTVNASLPECKKAQIKDVFVTVWGDDHRECSNFSLLPGLCHFVEHAYCENPTQEHIEKRFKAAVNMEYIDFTKIDLFDKIKEYNGENPDNLSLSKVFMWQDILMGLCDYNLGDTDFYEHYNTLEKEMNALSLKYDEFKILFDFYTALAKVLKTKANIGIKLQKAYLSDNKEELKNLKDNVLPKLYKDMSDLRYAHRKYFFDEYKPIGWEILDIKYGGAIMRIDTAISRLDALLSGEISEIDELKEPRLDFKIPLYTTYNKICSASRI